MSKNKRNRRHKNVSVYSIADQVEPNEPKSSQTQNLTKSFLAYLKGPSRWWVIALVAFLSLGVLGAGLKYLEDSAREEKAQRQQNPLAKKNESLLARANPFMPTPTPTPQLSKEYIYAGSRLLAVEDAAADAIPPADLAVWRPSSGVWFCLGGAGSQQFAVAWGMQGDIPVQGDYDGDGKTDLAIYRLANGAGTWWIYRSSDGSYYTVSLGVGDDQPAPADYDGDGRTDPAVFHQSSSGGVWNIAQSSAQTMASITFGLNDDKPAPADYDGDGKADPGVWRNSSATFYVLKSTDGQWQSQALSQTNDSPVPADYDGDGKADYAVRHGNDWMIKQSSDGQTLTITWLSGTYTAVQNDYDGDGKVDIASWKPSGKGAGNWYIRQSSQIGQSNELRVENWGTTGDIPVPAYYRR